MSLYEVSIETFEALSEDEKASAPNDGYGMKCAYYIRIRYNGETVLLESDAIELKNKTFSRDLSWIAPWLKQSYEIGKKDGLAYRSPLEPDGKIIECPHCGERFELDA